MGHDHHFLSRLDRVSRSSCELALDLYQDHTLVRDILDAMSIATRCHRVAIGMGPGEKPPHVIVARNGHFVTCLGEGMEPHDLPVISHAQFQAILNDTADLRARLEAANSRADSRDVIANIMQRWTRVSREQLFCAVGFREVLRVTFSGWVAEDCQTLLGMLPDLDLRMHRGKLSDYQCRAALGLLGSLAQLVLLISAGETLRVSGAVPHNLLPAYDTILKLVACFKTSAVGLRAVWSARTYAELMLWRCERMYVECAGPDDFITSTLVLLGIALKDPKWRGEVMSILSRPPGSSEAWSKVFNLVKPEIDKALNNDPEQRAGTTRKAREMLRTLVLPGQASKFGLNTPDGPPEDLALPALLHGGVPLTHRVCDVFFGIRVLASMRDAPPENLYFPEELLPHLRRRPAHQELNALLNHMLAGTPSRTPRVRASAPGPNEPCPCKSGSKYKKCCGKPSPPTKQEPEQPP